MLLKEEVLLLNSTYEVLGTVTVEKAVGMMFRESNPITVLANMPGAYLHSAGGFVLEVPSVIRLQNRAPMKRRRRWKRKDIFARDFNRCRYCVKKFPTKKLTLDHVKPRAKGGLTRPDNLVTACKPCNQRKADMSLQEAGMRLWGDTVQPHNGEDYARTDYKHLKFYLGKRPEWRDYLLGV